MDGVLIQCASLICRSLLAFLLSVWSMASISTSLVVCWLFLKWYVDSHEVSVCMSVSSMATICTSLVVCWLSSSGMLIRVRCCVSHLLSFSRVC